MKNFPEKWYIECTEENKELLQRRYNNTGGMCWTFSTNEILTNDNNIYLSKTYMSQDYQQITTEQFKEHFYPDEDKEVFNERDSITPFLDERFITPEQIKQLSETSTEAREMLSKLFPDIVKEDLSVEIPDSKIFVRRSSGDFTHKGFYLDEEFNWEIVTDSLGELVLVPTKKKQLNN